MQWINLNAHEICSSFFPTCPLLTFIALCTHATLYEYIEIECFQIVWQAISNQILHSRQNGKYWNALAWEANITHIYIYNIHIILVWLCVLIIMVAILTLSLRRARNIVCCHFCCFLVFFFTIARCLWDSHQRHNFSLVLSAAFVGWHLLMLKNELQPTKQ